MRKFSILFFAIFLLIACSQKEKKTDGFVVKAQINNPNNYSPYLLSYHTDDGLEIDTNYTVENGNTIVFRGKVSEPRRANLLISNNPATIIQTKEGFIPGPSLEFFLSNNEIKIKGDANTLYEASVTGGQANKEWATIKDKQNRLTDENWTSLKEAYNSKNGKDSEAIDRANRIRAANYNKEEELKRQFIHNNPKSLVSMAFLSDLQNSMSYDELKSTYEGLADQYKTNFIAKKLAAKIRNMGLSVSGKPAPDFSKKDINDETINLKDLRGKYVLIDFWGSWCAPCRASNPHLKELYTEYKNKGFEIVGIAQEQNHSLEENKESWKKAVEEDDLPWIQILNNEDIDRIDVVKTYGVTAFPTQILIDKNGKIISRFTGISGNLDKELDKIFN